MSGNNNNTSMKNVGVPNAFGNTGAVSQSMAINHRPPNLGAQPQPQGGPHFMGHFQASNPQAQALAQAQYAQAHAQARAQAQAQAAHVQFQTQLQAQAHSLSQMHNAPPSTNLGVASPPVSTPGMANVRRAPQKPSPRPPNSSGPGTASPLKTMELTPAARRRSQTLPGKQFPDKVAALLPESALYTQLLEFEARVDSALARKKLDIQESLKKPQRVQKTLRIYVFNTAANQPHQGSNKDSEPPSWSLKIIGRILENETDPETKGMLQSVSAHDAKFSSFFKKITIYLDQSLYPDNHVIFWESSRSPALHEGYEVKRTGDKEFTAIIRMELNYTPEKFKLSTALAELLGTEVETRLRVIAALWHYVKARKLQVPNDPSFFMCDPPLRKVFGEDKMKFGMVSQKVSQHLSPPQPIHLEHKIKLSGNNLVGNTCYDVLVDVPFPLDKEMSGFLVNLEKHKEIDACDEAICSAMKKIHEHSRRRAFFLGFSQSPAEFIDSIITSQSKDLKLAAGDATRNAEREQRSEFYNQPWVDDAVIRYINRKNAARNDAPGPGST